jgi:hypothetical protein
MGILGPHPETGVRIELERHDGASPPALVYGGVASTPGARHALTVTVGDGGSIDVALPADVGAAHPELAEQVRLLVRTAMKHAASEGVPPPRRIVRWRPDR